MTELDDEELELEVVVTDEDELELDVVETVELLVEVVVSMTSPHDGEAAVPTFSNTAVAPVVPSVFTRRQPCE